MAIPLTYEQLVRDLQDKAADKKEKISIFIRNLETNPKSDDVIINQTDRCYNWLHIVYGAHCYDSLPKHIRKALSREFRKDERMVFHCSSLKELKEVIDYYLDNPSVWMIELNPEDVLERC